MSEMLNVKDMITVGIFAVILIVLIFVYIIIKSNTKNKKKVNVKKP